MDDDRTNPQSNAQTDAGIDPLELQDQAEDEGAELAHIDAPADAEGAAVLEVEVEQELAKDLDKVAVAVPGDDAPIAKKTANHGISQAMIDAPLKNEDWFDEGRL